MQADISGPQRKVVRHRVRPARGRHADGITLDAGKTQPFIVERGWNAPAGHYREQFFLVDPATREILFEGPTREVRIWGLQSITDITDEVTVPIALAPGSYQIVFALGGIKGGEVTVEARAASEAAA